jgi:hypothetical protein
MIPKSGNRFSDKIMRKRNLSDGNRFNSMELCSSAAYLKFLHHKPLVQPGTSNRKAALES